MHPGNQWQKAAVLVITALSLVLAASVFLARTGQHCESNAWPGTAPYGFHRGKPATVISRIMTEATGAPGFSEEARKERIPASEQVTTGPAVARASMEPVVESFTLPLDSSFPEPDVNAFIRFINQKLCVIAGSHSVEIDISGQTNGHCLEGGSKCETQELTITFAAPEEGTVILSRQRNLYCINVFLRLYELSLVFRTPFDRFEAYGELLPSSCNRSARHLFPEGGAFFEYDPAAPPIPVDNSGFVSFELFRNPYQKGMPFLKWSRVVFFREVFKNGYRYYEDLGLPCGTIRTNSSSIELVEPGKTEEFIGKLRREIDRRLAAIKAG